MIGLPLKSVMPFMPGMSFQSPVTAGRFVIACANAGKFECSAVITCAGESFSVVDRNETSFGSSAVTDDSGSAPSSAAVWGKSFCTAASALAGVVCSCLAV